MARSVRLASSGSGVEDRRLIFAALSILGFTIGGLPWSFRGCAENRTRKVDKTFRRQPFLAAAHSLGHGGNDAQTVGII